jgi:glycosyltransferase involved in cell wall biosynthesis
MKLVEALYHGKAVITTPHLASKLDGLINEKNVLIGNDFASIVSYARRLVSDIDFRKNIEINAKQYFDEHLSPARHVLLWKNVFSQLLDYC